MKTYLVTGGAGFIGSHIVETLIKRGDKVVVIDDLSSGKRKNLPSEAIFYKQSITENLDKMFSKYSFDGIFHLAAIPRIQISISQPVETTNVNIGGLVNIFWHAVKYKVPRIVYSSSSSVYGPQETMPIVETAPKNPVTPYALQKYVGELFAHRFYFLYGLESVCLRYFNVYGQRQDPDSGYAAAIPKFIKQALNNEPITVYGSGEQTRDFTHVSDVVKANILSMETISAHGHEFNIGTGQSTSVNDLIKGIEQLRGIPLVIENSPAVPEALHSQADNSWAAKILEWKPAVNLAQGLVDTYNYYSQ